LTGPASLSSSWIDNAADTVPVWLALNYVLCQTAGIAHLNAWSIRRQSRSLAFPRTVLEWRVALDSPWRNRYLAGLDQRLILICDHGYSSILAASNLVQLGFHRAADVIGGFEAWKEDGLPVAPCRRRLAATDALPGTARPD
jgi:rhodanese-related sulfurtransferase